MFARAGRDDAGVDGQYADLGGDVADARGAAFHGLQPLHDAGDAVAQGADPFRDAPAVHAGGLHVFHAVARMIDGAIRGLGNFRDGRRGRVQRAFDLGGAAAQVHEARLYVARLVGRPVSAVPRYPRSRSPACRARRRAAVARRCPFSTPMRRSVGCGAGPASGACAMSSTAGCGGVAARCPTAGDREWHTAPRRTVAVSHKGRGLGKR